MQTLDIQICDKSEDAPNYNVLNKAGENWKGLAIKKAIVVKGGMTSGKCTMDLIFEDDNGGQYISLVTGSIFESLVQVINAANKQQQ